MLHTLGPLLVPAVMDRLTLLVNHVVGSEPAATERMKGHAGRALELRLEGWPSMLPPWPPLVFTVTPAGLFEWNGVQPALSPALLLRLDLSDPSALAQQVLSGRAPALAIEGDAALAADVNWLVTQVRWDVAADLERAFGPMVAAQLQQSGRAIAEALRSAVAGVSGLKDRLRPGAA